MTEIEPTIDIQEAQRFVHESAQAALESLGYSGLPQVEFGDKWACDVTSGRVIIDATAFGDETYKPKWRQLAFQHEIEAHAAKAKFEPESAKWQKQWVDEHPGGHLFLNILADVAGNRQIMSKDPSAREGWSDFYRTKLFSITDYRFIVDQGTGEQTDKPMPRHVQMLYALIREKMVLDEPCSIDPEVRTVLDGLANFNGDFDILNYSTQSFKTPTEYLSRTEQMRLWRSGIWPKYLELYEQDENDPNLEHSKDGSPQNGSGVGEPSPFQPFYDEYDNEHHPGSPHQPDDGQSSEAKQAMDAIMQGLPVEGSPQSDSLKGKSESTGKTEPTSGENSAEDSEPNKAGLSIRERAKAARAEFAQKEGVTTEQLTDYLALQKQVQGIIGEMHSVFEQFVNERAALKWRLSHGHADGVLLDPDNLARTIIQISTGHTDDMRPYMDYERQERSREVSGKLDLWLVIDTSGSMGEGAKANTAAKSAIAVLEGLDDFNQVIRKTSAALGYNLDYDVRTAVVTFNNAVFVVKPLGQSLTIKERCKAVSGIQNISGSTADYLGIAKVEAFYAHEPADDRKKVVIVLSDGESNDVGMLKIAVGKLKQVPNMNVFAIGIESGAAEANYAPNGKTIQNVAELPDTLSVMVTNLFR